MSSVHTVTRVDATCTDLLTCIYNLNSIEASMFYDLVKNGPATLDDVARWVSRDRSTVHRGLQKLVGAGLVYKEVKGLTAGGYCHVYRAVEIQKIKADAEAKVNEICDGLKRLIDRFEYDVVREKSRIRTPASK